MAYTKIGFENKPSKKTPISAENLNHMEQGIYDAHVAVEDLETHKANSILSKSTGEVVTTTDSAKAKPKNIRLYGKTEQDSTEGNQLFDANIFTSKATDECSVTNNGDGSFTITGNGTASTSFGLYAETYGSEYLKTGMLYLNNHGEAEPTLHLYGVNEAGERLFTLTSGTHGTNITQDIIDNLYKITFAMYCSAGSTLKAGTITPMLYQDGDGTYEPYTGGASPNKNYQQPLNSHGDSGSIVGKVLSGNLYNPLWRGTWVGKEIYTKGCTATEKKGVFTIVANQEDFYVWEIASSYSTNYSGQLLRIPNGVTKISFLLSNVELNKNYINLYDENLDTIKTNNVSSNKATVPVVEGAKYFSLRFGKGDAVAGKTYETTVMVNYGEPMDYKPYTAQPFTVLTPNGFMGLPVSEGGNCIINGQRYMSNIKDYKSGKNIENVYKFRLTSDLTWAYVNTTNYKNHNFQIRLNANGFPKGYTTDNNTFRAYAYATKLTHFRCKDMSFDNTGFGNEKAYVYGDELTVSFASDSEINSLAKWKQFLDDNEVYVEYIIPDPIITDLTQEELDQYNALLMNYPNTTVVNDAGAYMEVEYVCDTQKHIEQNYVPNEKYNALEKRVAEIEKAIVS